MLGMISKRKHDEEVNELERELRALRSDIDFRNRAFSDVTLANLKNAIYKLEYQGCKKQDIKLIMTYPEFSIFTSLMDSTVRDHRSITTFDGIPITVDNKVSRFFAKVEEK